MPHVDTPMGRCRFGVARCDITPPVGIYHRMWGAARHDRSTGVHRPLTATAMCFRALDGDLDAAAEQVVVAVDHCLLWAKEMNALLTSVAQESNLPTEQITIAFSHTHGAGFMGLERVGLPGGELIPPYLHDLGGKVARIVREARSRTAESWITCGTGRCDLAANRDFTDPDSRRIVCGFNPDGPADDTLMVARVTDAASGELRASIVNYACHPTTLAWQNTLISPDYPGALRECVEHETGAPCVFLQGASGDLGPREGFVGDPAVADRNGRQLGHAVLSVLEALPPPGTRFRYAGAVLSGATIGTWEHIPLDQHAAQQRARWRGRHGTIALAYRPDLPAWEETVAQRDRWSQEEQAASDAGDEKRARDCRAMAERMTRTLARLDGLPPGTHFPMPITLWRIGDVLFVAVEAEHYQELQVRLRQRFPDLAIVVITLANGWRAAYLPRADCYGKGIYQESVAVLAAGCLERLIDEIANLVEHWAVPRYVI